jgi:hypothetical protein
MTQKTKQPSRTIGISLAVMLGIMFYTVIPIIQIGFTLYIRSSTNGFEASVGGNIDPIGGPYGFTAISDFELLIRIIPAILYLLFAIMAWRGKPHSMRYIIVMTAILIFGWHCLLTYLRVRSYQEAGIFASTLYEDRLQNTYLMMMGLTTLYIAWYLNRAPARAFFRGYYLQDNKKSE